MVVLLRKLLNCGSEGETIWWWLRESNRNVVVMVEKNSSNAVVVVEGKPWKCGGVVVVEEKQ